MTGAPPLSADAVAETRIASPERAELDAAVALIDDADYDGALRRLDRYLGSPRLSLERAEAQVLRGLVLLMLDRDEDALAAYAAAAEAQPRNPAIFTLQFEHARMANALTVAEVALDQLVDGFPADARALSHLQVFPLINALRDQGEEDRADAITMRLARIGFGDWESRQWLAHTAARLHLAKGDAAEAASLIETITSREVLESMLVQKSFSPLWPVIEARAGPHMARAEAAAVLRANRNLAERPADVRALRGVVHALREARRFDEGDRLAADFAATPEAMRAIDEPGGWLVNTHALLLHEAGRKEEADRRFAAMRVIDIEEQPWLISMIINRIELLVRDRQFARAAPLVAEAEILARDHGSPYARQLVRRLHICTLQGLERTDEAAALAGALIENAEDAKISTIDGLLCLGREDEAAKLALEVLADPQAAESAILTLQPETLGSSDPSLWREGWALLRGRAEVEAAYHLVGRDLPATMLPATAAPSFAAQ